MKREEFFKITPREDLRRQLEGLSSTVPASITTVIGETLRSKYTARLFTTSLPDLGSDEDIARRVVIITKLVVHCSLREPKPSRKDHLLVHKYTSSDES